MIQSIGGQPHICKKEHSFEYSFFNDSGSVLLSRAVAHQVSSALKSLTTVFGMGTGVTSLLLPPNICQTPSGVLTLFCVSKTERRRVGCSCLLHNCLGQALDLLVSVSLIRYRTYTSDLSTTQSTWGLTSLRYGKSYLRVDFTLRCLQRLFLPYIATQLCHWHDNWCTSGTSIPVLSY